MTLSQRLRMDASDIWDKIFSHPFVLELYSGSLPLEKFKFYAVQDYNYLVTMYKCLSLLASKAEPDIARFILEMAYIDASIEMDNYKKLLESLNLNIEDVIGREPAPTNRAYMDFLLSTCATGTLLEGLVAILPCFWSYLEIAENNKSLLLQNKVRLYREWAEVYLKEEYRDIVQRLRETVDDLWDGTYYEKYRKIFLLGSKYEYLFWDMAYNMEKWKI